MTEEKGGTHCYLTIWLAGLWHNEQELLFVSRQFFITTDKNHHMWGLPGLHHGAPPI